MIMLVGLIGEVTCPYGGYSCEAPGLIVFLSNIIKLLTTVGGLLLFLNLVLAGLKYLMSGSDPKSLQEAGSSITNSIIGLIIIAASFIIVAIFSLILFGDPTYILNPKISGPDTPAAYKCPTNLRSITDPTSCAQCQGTWDVPRGFCH